MSRARSGKPAGDESRRRRRFPKELKEEAVQMLRDEHNLQRLALFQGASNEDPPSSGPKGDYAIDPKKRRCKAGYMTPKPKG
jgi:hypothetical protein